MQNFKIFRGRTPLTGEGVKFCDNVRLKKSNEKEGKGTGGENPGFYFDNSSTAQQT